jgi:hypothetical protein
MAMKLVKKTVEYSIYQRGDDRYAVKDADKQPVNGEEKVRILLAENLIKVSEPSAPAEPAAEEAAEAPTAEAIEEAPAEEAAAEEEPAQEAPAEEAPEEEK